MQRIHLQKIGGGVTKSQKCSRATVWRTITMMSEWRQWRLKSPVSRLFAQPFVQVQMKENIKASLAFVRGIHRHLTGGFPSQRASNAENVSIWWRHVHVVGQKVTYMSLKSDKRQIATMEFYKSPYLCVADYNTHILLKTANCQPCRHRWLGMLS